MFKNNTQSLDITNNSNDFYEEPNYVKLRLGFVSSTNFHRQILLGFMEKEASEHYDAGYDALHIDAQPDDMYFTINNKNLTIQGVGSFSVNEKIALELKISNAGLIEIKLDEVLHLNASQEIYIFDKIANTYTNIRLESFKINLEAGTYDKRFYLTFKASNSTTANENVKSALLTSSLTVMYQNSEKLVTIYNNDSDNLIKNITLFSLLGQEIKTWEMNAEYQSEINLPISSIATGVYVVKINSTKGTISKKISIK